MNPYIAQRQASIPFTGLDGDLVHSTFDSCFKDILTAEWCVKSDGNVEAPTGYFAVVEIPLNLRERADMVDAVAEDRQDDTWHQLQAGWYVTRETDNGLIYVFRVDGQAVAEDAYNALQRQYSKWAADEESGD